MDMLLCWNSAEKTYNPFPHNCFTKEVEDGFHPCEGSMLGVRVWAATFSAKFALCLVLLSAKCG